MNAHPSSRPRRSALAAVLVLVLVVTAAALVACGDGSTPAPPTRTLTPEPDQSPGKRGSTTSAAPSATPTGAPSASASATRARITDKTIKANILARIAREPGLRGFEIIVMVTDGNVYLRGRVRTKEQRSLVERIALTEPGVKKVVSSIDVDDAAGY